MCLPRNDTEEEPENPFMLPRRRQVSFRIRLPVRVFPRSPHHVKEQIILGMAVRRMRRASRLMKDLRLKTAELVDLLGDEDGDAAAAKEDLAERERRHRELRQWVSLRVARFIDETA